MNTPHREKKAWSVALICAVALGVVVLVVGGLLLSTLSLNIQLRGDKDVTVEMGQSYADQGAFAVLTSELLGEFILDVPVEAVLPDVTEGISNYPITYQASFWWLKATTERNVKVLDGESPVITLISVPGHYTIPGQSYVEEGYVATDNLDGDITDKVQREVTETEVIYTVTDSSGNTTTIRRTIVYHDPEPPVLTLTGDAEITITIGSSFTDPGFTASDNLDGDLTAQVQVSGSVNTLVVGTYTLTYSVTDSYGNTATATRNVVVNRVQQTGTVNPGNKVVYLTFDDGPSAYTKELLDVLAKYNVKATFFVCDKGSTNNAIMKRIVDEGHSIGVHSATHDYQEIYASEEAYLADFNEVRDLIKRITGVETNLFRFPGGSSNGVSKFNPGIMTRLTKMMTDMGYYYFDWNVSSGDASTGSDAAKTAEDVFENVIAGISKRNVSVVLQHDIKKFSVQAVEDIIIWCLDNGYTLLPLDETSPVCHHSVNN